MDNRNVMHKNDLIYAIKQAIQDDIKATNRELDTVITQTFQIIKDELVHGDKVVLKGFGTFETRARAPHRYVNPYTKQAYTTPPKAAVAFRACSALKAAVAASGTDDNK